MPLLRITAQTEGFRRCGIPHSTQPTDHPEGRFTDEQIAILKADPMLTVVEIKGAPPRPNANETIAMVKIAATEADLDALAIGEDRKSVLAAIEVKRKEMSA